MGDTYVILDVTLLEIVCDDKGKKLVFLTRQKAYNYANENINDYRIVVI